MSVCCVAIESANTEFKNDSAVTKEESKMTETARQRPEFRNINAISDLPTYRLPAAGCPSCTASVAH